jgi:hypothetical protein
MSRKLFARSPLSTLALLCAAISPHPQGFAQTAVAISGIKADQIFQRNGTLVTSEATIYLKPRDTIPAAYTKYSIALLTPTNTVERTLVNLSAYNRSLPLAFSLATGNSRKRVRVSFYDGNNVEGMRWESPPFSVGEVFLVAGQSNAANHGFADGAAVSANPIHSAADPLANSAADPLTRVWSAVTEPMPFATSSGVGNNASPWPAFADHLGTKLGVPVGIVNVARATAPVEWWLPGSSEPLANSVPENIFVNRLLLGANAVRAQAGADSETDIEKKYSCSFRAVLWHQGESNAERAAPSRFDYVNNLKTVAQQFRTQTGCPQPWMIAKTSWLADHWRLGDQLAVGQQKWDAEQTIRRAQHYLATRVPEIGTRQPVFQLGPDTDLLIGDYRSATNFDAKYRQDGLHLRRKGLTLHGKMWAERVARTLGADSAAVEPVETMIPEVKAVWNVYTNSLGRQPADIIQDTEGLRYWVRDLELRNIDDTQVESNAASLYAAPMQSSAEYGVRQTFLTNVARAATATEVSFWVAEIAASRETQATVATKIRVELNPAWDATKKKVWLMYIRTLNRTTPEMANDMAGVDYWANVIRTGTSEATVEASFKTSVEYVVRNAFMKAKLRQPTPAELSTFMPKLQSEFGNDATRLADALWAQTSN